MYQFGLELRVNQYAQIDLKHVLWNIFTARVTRVQRRRQNFQLGGAQ